MKLMKLVLAGFALSLTSLALAQEEARPSYTHITIYKPKVVYNTDVVASDLVSSRGVRDNNLWVHANSFGNLEALRAMTSVGGDLMALTGKHNPYPNKLGVIEAGGYADIILLDGNPLEDITVLGARPKMFEGEPRTEEGFEKMPFIMKDGKIYKNTLK